MENSLIQKIVSRSNRKRLIWSALGLLVVGALFLFNLRYLYNFVSGPFNAQAEEILQFEKASQARKYWLRLQGQDMVNSGIQYYTTSKSGVESIEASYYLMPVGQKLLLVRLPGDKTMDSIPGQVTGWLSNISEEENREVIQALVNDMPQLDGAFLPYKLESGAFRTGGVLGMAAALVVLGFSVWGLITFARYADDPEKHPIMKDLARFGPLDFTVNRIESELASPHPMVGKLHLTNSWLVHEGPTSLMATRYEDVAWIHKYVFKQKSYGITVRTTYYAYVYDRFGKLCNFLAGSKEPQADQMLEAIYQRAPWAIAGYSKELDKAWKKDRAGFLTAVEQRKAKLAAA